MLLLNPIDPEKQRTRALAKVYALLLRLAEENETARPENFAEESGQAAQQIDPNSQGKESTK